MPTSFCVRATALIVPQYNGTVKVNGAVMYSNTVAYERGKRPSYYINQAGGYASGCREGSLTLYT